MFFFCYKKTISTYILIEGNDYMNEIVSFNKEIEFKTMINKITSISLEHTLIVEDDSIRGDLIVSGTYKQTEASQIENPFSYKIPVDIEIDDKYNLEDITIDIDDFTYDINDNVLKLNIDILLDNLKLKEPKKEDSMIETLDDLFLETDDRKEELNVPIEESKEESEEEKTTDQQEIDIQSESLFSNLDKSKETYETYSVYIMRDNDSLEEIINKYNTSREKLEEYNNLNEIKIGTKLIIPNTKNE